MGLPADIIGGKVKGYIEGLLLDNENFTGKVELNFKDGQLMDINETKRTKAGDLWTGGQVVSSV